MSVPPIPAPPAAHKSSSQEYRESASDMFRRAVDAMLMPCLPGTETKLKHIDTLRSRVSEHLYRNAEWIPINSGYGPDTGGPQEQSFSFGSSRTGVAFFPKTSKNGHISVVVAPIGLKFCVHARFLVS